MNSSDIINYKPEELGFDSFTYQRQQTEAIIERLSHFPQGKLYLEIGGKFLFDPHAARVLPGFDPAIKLKIVQNLTSDYEVIFCVNADDIASDRQLSSKIDSYTETTILMIQNYQKVLKKRISIAINKVSPKNCETVEIYKKRLEARGFTAYLRFAILGYPNPDIVLSPEGYQKDEYIPTSAPLVLVLGAASGSGKMSTCLGQLYHDHQHGQKSGYAKYELFPIWNLPLNHPVNLAYESATVDIGDYNLIDPFHLQAYGTEVVNYNRDVDAFPIVRELANRIVSADNFMRTYKSPTDMGISKAGFSITNDENVKKAAIAEISRRIEWFKALAEAGKGQWEWVKRCEEIFNKVR